LAILANSEFGTVIAVFQPRLRHSRLYCKLFPQKLAIFVRSGSEKPGPLPFLPPLCPWAALKALDRSRLAVVAISVERDSGCAFCAGESAFGDIRTSFGKG
jgi:hypothetical protein